MPITIILLIASLVHSPITTGNASQYGQGVMEGTIRLRQGWNQLPQDLSQYDVFVAVPECTDIGEDFWIRPVGAQKWERALVTDCASKSDHQSETDLRSGYQWMADGNFLVEIDAGTPQFPGTAQRWNTVGRMIRVETVKWILWEEADGKQGYANQDYTNHVCLNRHPRIDRIGCFARPITGRN